MIKYDIIFKNYYIYGDEMSEENNKNEINETPQPQSLNEEIRDFNKEVLKKPDSPLVVHKKGDASYEDNIDQYEMNSTHVGEERPTLERHRFRKEKKKSKAPIIIIIILVILAAVFAGLYYSGNITFNGGETTAASTTAATESTTEDIVAKYKGTIVIKGTYIFVDGVEVNGIEGLQNALKYEDPNPTAYEIIVEDENTGFLNNEVLAILESMGFFTEDTKVTHLDKTGLMAAGELLSEEAPSEAPSEIPSELPSETPSEAQSEAPPEAPSEEPSAEAPTETVSE